MEGKTFALLTQNIGSKLKMFWPSHVKRPVETGLPTSPETRQAASLREIMRAEGSSATY